MDLLKLVKPTKEMDQQIWEYRQEYLDHGEEHINGSCGLSHFNNFDEWLFLVQSIEKDKLSRENVHASTFFTVREEDNKIIGSIQLRHALTEALEKHGGHIGYGVRPTERMKGYATEQLKYILEIAKQMGLPRVMISCDKDNAGSAKVIQNNHGVLEWEGNYNDKIIQIYWIECLI